MKLLVDEAIWGAPELFGPLGDVRTFDGRRLRPDDLEDADALIVRSVSPVGEPLLDGSAVRFVGAASSGIDHVDRQYLASRGITLADAAGGNAVTVAEYVAAALWVMARRCRRPLEELTLGVVGVGRIGSIVADFAAGLDMKVVGCDPPRRSAGDAGLVDFPALADAADIVTLHVPLTRDGPDATADVVDAAWLGRLRPGAWLVNTSRGGVVREDHLLAAIADGRIGGCVLDVWRGEPDVNRELLAAADIATPHIAGQSIEARRRAALMIRDALARHLGIPGHVSGTTGAAQTAGSIGVPPVRTTIADPGSIGACPLRREARSRVPPVSRPTAATIAAIRSTLDLEAVSRAMKAELSPAAGPEAFDALRARFANRRETISRP